MPTVVFISYSHDSAEHLERVLALSERLRKDGLETRLDQYLNGAPAEGWPRWMLNRLDEADAVLVVCTETYYRRFRGHEVADKGKGVDWEGLLITQELYDAKSANLKFIPVMLAEGQTAFIPEPLRGTNHYAVTSEAAYQALYDVLLGQAGIEPGEVGELRKKPRQKGKPLTFDQRQRIAPSRLPTGVDLLVGREDELAWLDAAWADPAVHVATLVAWGGVGKTALVGRWAASLAARGYDGADYLDWSFYSQGTREEGGASADVFIAKALELFGDPETAKSAASPWDKGARLAELVARRVVVGGFLEGWMTDRAHSRAPLTRGIVDRRVDTAMRQERR